MDRGIKSAAGVEIVALIAGVEQSDGFRVEGKSF